MTAYTLLASSSSSSSSVYSQKCHPTIEMLIVPRRKAQLIKLLICVPILTLLVTSIYYTFYYDLPDKSRAHAAGVVLLPTQQQVQFELQQHQQQVSSLETANNSNNAQLSPQLRRAQLAAHRSQASDLQIAFSIRAAADDVDDDSNTEVRQQENSLPRDKYLNRRLRLHVDKLQQQNKAQFGDDKPFEGDESTLKQLDERATLGNAVTSSFEQGYRFSLKANSKIKQLNAEEERGNAQSVAVLPAPSEVLGFGEMGRPVVLRNLTKDQQQLVSVGWENNAFNQYISDLISLNRTLPDVRDPACKSVQYSRAQVASLPPTSIIICFHNEAWSVLLRTVHSAINRSPKGLIKEIILVDDFSTKSHLKQQLEDYVRPLEIVKVVRATKREGLIRARLLGAKHATAPVLTFLDSHCECADGWLEPLLARIQQDSRAVVCPVIDVISDKTFEYHYKNDADSISVGGFDWNLQFNWHNVPERERKRRQNAFDPIRSPTMAGGLFSIDKTFFERLGTYDSGFDIWGGENLELSFKTWMCGGTLEIIPCSHVGHVFRSRSPYKWRTGINVLKRNSVRLAEVWMDDYKKYYYDRIGHDLGDFGDVSDRLELRKQLHCKPFSYFVEQIYPELFIPGEAVAYGEIKNEAGKIKMCLDSPARKVDLHKPLGVYPCHGSGGNQYWLLSKDGEIRRDEACVDYAGHDVELFPCHGSGGNQLWYYDDETMLIKHSTSGRCLELSADRVRVQMSDCDSSLDAQRWRFQHYNSTLASRPDF